MSKPIQSATLSYLITRIRKFVMSVDDRSTEVADLVATFNALTIPKAYVCVDNRIIHVIGIGNKLPVVQDPTLGTWIVGLPREVLHVADVVWRFNPSSGLWNTVKDRTGLFAPLCPIKCDGFPVKAPTVQGPAVESPVQQ